ncbi:MAG TPA: hypothetical protein VM865_06370 [Acidobacteriaceae bacterium]|jgi:hypothetical protein|nr:hypothetical protein [Acidobacteriaceae bacterium]
MAVEVDPNAGISPLRRCAPSVEMTVVVRGAFLSWRGVRFCVGRLYFYCREPAGIHVQPDVRWDVGVAAAGG